MTSSTSYNRVGNGLSLLANKCAANTFDISSGMVYASMRDQIVRAELVITDLHQCDPKCRNILIIGAGLAGMTAAACAADLGMEVVVLETKSKPFSLQRKVTQRMVGPFMYEWPSIISKAQDYPPSLPNLTGGLKNTPTWNAPDPISADDLVNQIMPWYNNLVITHNNLTIYYNQSASSTKAYIQSFIKSHSTTGPAVLPQNVPKLTLADGSSFLPNYIILAVGMGKERVYLMDGDKNQRNSVRGKPFWGNDDFRRRRKMNWKVGVFGGGDGALQDVLRLLTRFSHPLDFIRELHKTPNSIASDLDNVIDHLDTIEQQSRLLRTWSGDIYKIVDEECQEIAASLASKVNVRLKVFAMLRPGLGKVIHIHRHNHFAKAYLLNRFCVHLIEQCLSHHQPVGVVKYERIKSGEATSAFKNSAGQSVVTLSTGIPIIFDRVAVRFGPDKGDLEKRQLVKLSPTTKADRTTMAGIPLPFLVAE